MIRISGKIPVTIHPIFWLMAGLIGWLNSLSLVGTVIWMSIILISVLVHEFGHALTAVAFGQRARIDLVAFGGLTQRTGRKIRLWQDFIIVLNGPCAGFALCIAALVMKSWLSPQSGSILSHALSIVVYVNAFWTVVNLLPVIPLDGGRLLSIVMEGILGFKGIKVSFFLSIVLALVFSLLLFFVQNLFGGVIFLMLAFESFRMWRAASTMTEQDQDNVLQKMLKTAEENLRLGKKEEAQKEFQQVLAQAKAGVLYITAAQYLADIFFLQGQFQQIYDLLLPIMNDIDVKALHLLQQSAYRLGKWDRAIEIGNRIYQSSPNYDTALINAFCYAILGEERPAVGWLQCCQREGLPNLHEIVQKREFDKIRNHALFQQLIKSSIMRSQDIVD